MTVMAGAIAALVFFVSLAIVGLVGDPAPRAAPLRGIAKITARSPLVHAAFTPTPRVDALPSTPAAIPAIPAPPGPTVHTLTITRGDTLMGLIISGGARRDDAYAAARALAKRVNPRRLKIGQKLAVAIAPDGALMAADLTLAATRHVIVERIGPRFKARRQRDAYALPVAVTDGGAPTTPHTLALRKGDTLMKLLLAAGSDRAEADAAIAALRKSVDLRRLRIGQRLTVVFGDGDARDHLAAISLALGVKGGDSGYVIAARRDDGSFGSRLSHAPLVASLDPTPRPATATTPPQTPTQAPAATPAVISGGAEVPPPPPRPEFAALAKQGLAPAATARDDSAVYRTLSVRKGDTLMSLLLRAGSTRADAEKAISALSRHYNPRRLQIGQALTVVLDDAAARPKLTRVSLAVSDKSFILAGLDDSGGFTSLPTRDPLSDAFDNALFATAPPPKPPVTFVPLPDDVTLSRLDLRAGDTLMQALLRAGSDRREAAAAIIALSKVVNPRRLQVGQSMTVTLAPDDAGRAELERVALTTAPGRKAEVGRVDAGGFAAREVDVPLNRVLVHIGGRIDSSLYQAASRAGIPRTVLTEMIGAFSYDIDFQRDLQPGDRFEVLFERYYDDAGAPVRDGDVVYASLRQVGGAVTLYRFVDKQGRRDFYSADGQSVRKALLRTPINGARLTSGFGMRKHPILGYTKMHRGVDFAARRGTPIMAAGDGVIERAGWFGAYGRYVRIRHRGKYSTAYAHMSGIAKGIKRGRRVRQGQIIGYVGASGRATGPHLHYEVLVAGRQINPMRVKLPTGAKLAGAEAAAFAIQRAEIERRLAALPLVQSVADAGPFVGDGCRVDDADGEVC